MRYRVLIKGRESDAEEAVVSRGLSIYDHEYSPKTGDTIGNIDTDGTKLAKWLCENPHDAPFPVGALLFYSFNTKDRE